MWIDIGLTINPPMLLLWVGGVAFLWCLWKLFQRKT